jgi:hypothetical protein
MVCRDKVRTHAQARLLLVAGQLVESVNRLSRVLLHVCCVRLARTLIFVLHTCMCSSRLLLVCRGEGAHKFV